MVQHQSLTHSSGDNMETVREEVKRANSYLEEVRKGLVEQRAREMVVLTDLEEWLGRQEEAMREVSECEEGVAVRHLGEIWRINNIKQQIITVHKRKQHFLCLENECVPRVLCNPTRAMEKACLHVIAA